MRYVSSIPPATTNPVQPQVNGLTSVHAVKAVHPREPELPSPGQHAIKQDVRYPSAQRGQGDMQIEDRRKYCRRAGRQHVLIELRCGIDRRRHNLRGSDIHDHIDEKA